MADVLVVKLGSSSVTKAAGPDQELLSSALSDAIEAQRLGWHVVIVSSGAESSGFAHLSATLGHRSSARLAAAVGQPLLMNMYSAPIGGRTHVLAQVLISQADLRSAAQMRVVADVLAECFRAGIVPIVNGNDVTDPDGSDNDSVATGIAVSVGADKLLLLTDVQGVYQGVPGRSPRYETLDVAEIGQVRLAASGTGRGGMRSKLRAAELASHNGIETVIANARSAHAILSCVKGQAIGTRVLPVSEARSPDKRWIAGIARSHGRLVINREAEASIRRGSSLFASGIKRVHGNFAAGDVIDVTTPNGQLIARGGANVSSSLLSLVRAMQSDEVGQVMAEIVYQFASTGAGPGVPGGVGGPGGADAADTAALRPPVRSALDTVRNSSYPVKRRLAIELLGLFPQTAVGCMTDTTRRNGRRRLAQFYGRLSSDLSFIDRGRLVVF
jgi:glutamate 5-kinase